MLLKKQAFSLLFATALSLVSFSADASSLTMKIGEIEYGPVETLSGVYFTNFENTLFAPCDQFDDCAKSWTSKRDYAVRCADNDCNDLEARIRSLNGNHDRWGEFYIKVRARRSVAPTRPESIFDRQDKVLFVKILEMKLLEGHD